MTYDDAVERAVGALLSEALRINTNPDLQARNRAAAERLQQGISVLCVRDPDYQNEYVADGPLAELTIDVGGQWSSHKDFCSCLRDGDGEALDYERSMLEHVKNMTPDNPVREAVESFFTEARKP